MSRRLRPLDWCFIVALLLLAVALRFGGLAWGQPDASLTPGLAALQLLPENAPLHPDEHVFIQRPLRMALTGRLNPEFFINPSFLINLNFFTYILTGSTQGLSVEDWAGTTERQQAPFTLYLIGRTYSALGGVLAVAGVYAAARLVGGRSAAAAAGLLAAVGFLLVQHAHYATTSSLAAGFASVTLWAALFALRSPRWAGRALAVAGIAAGLAVGNRYNAAPIALIVLAAGAWLVYRHRSRRMLWAALIGCGLVPLVFALTTPHIIFDTHDVLKDIRYISEEYLNFWHDTFTTDYGLWFEYRYLMLFGLGLPGTLAALVGVYAAWRRFRQGWPWPLVTVLLVLLYLIPYSLIVLRTVRPISAEQLLVPILPPLMVLAGVGVAWIRTAYLPAGRAWLPLAAVVTVLPMLIGSAQFVHLLRQPDTRLLMQQWVYQHVPPGATIHLNGPYNVPLDMADYPWTQNYGTQYPPVAEVAGADYVLLSDAWYVDVLRSGAIIREDYLTAMRDYLDSYENALPRVAWIERPVWFGSDALMHTASYWHQPGLVLYCAAACGGGG